MTEPPDPGFDTFDDVTLLPCRRDGRGPSGYSFGAAGRDGAAIPAFAHPWCTPRPPDVAAAPVPIEPGRFIYGGLLMNHFGHFLLEAMARLWFIRAHPELPVVWHTIDLPVPHTLWPGWREEIWTLLGLHRHRHRIVNGPHRLGEVVVPRPGLTPDGIHPLQAASLVVVPGPPAPGGGRVWLSRSALPDRFGRLLGEAALERSLAARGWTVRHPESLGVAAQAGLFADAEMVAGFAGSAFHAVLLAAAPQARLRILRRPSVGTAYDDIAARARGLDQAHVEVALRPAAAVTAWTTFELVDPEAAAETVIAAAA